MSNQLLDDPAGAVDCMQHAVAVVRTALNEYGARFQSTAQESPYPDGSEVVLTLDVQFPDEIGSGTVSVSVYHFGARARASVELVHDRIFRDGRDMFLNDYKGSMPFYGDDADTRRFAQLMGALDRARTALLSREITFRKENPGIAYPPIHVASKSSGRSRTHAVRR